MKASQTVAVFISLWFLHMQADWLQQRHISTLVMTTLLWFYAWVRCFKANMPLFDSLGIFFTISFAILIFPPRVPQIKKNDRVMGLTPP